MTSPANRTAFVSGASTGVGYGIACALAQAGYDLAVTSRDAARLDALMKEPAMKGRKVVPVKLDVRADGDIARALAAAAGALAMSPSARTSSLTGTTLRPFIAGSFISASSRAASRLVTARS